MLFLHQRYRQRGRNKEKRDERKGRMDRLATDMLIAGGKKSIITATEVWS